MSTKMLCASARTRFIPSFSLLPPQPIFRRPNCLIHRRRNHITMSAQDQVVEHVVLVKVKPDVDSSKVAAMISGLNGLTSLNLTLHLTAGQLLRSRSSSLNFTHMLHSRYRSKDDLQQYAVHPEHVRVVTENIKPIIDDIMAVDWMSNSASSVSLKPGSAMRVTFVKLKENLGENEKSRVLEVIGGMKDEFPRIEELSVGENFSDRAKGYTIASVAVLGGPADLEALDSNAELVQLHKEKVKDLIESVVVVDYVIPPPQAQAANL
ncbi:putative stress-response A/B barrel domain-containing protein HS1/DABB1 [Helianthus debilis subsp. tardiflorus]